MEQIVIGLAERYGPGVAVMMVSMFIALTMTRIFSRKVDAQSNLSDAEANTQTTISSLALSNQKHVTDLQAQLITNLSQQIAQQRDLSELRGEFNTYRATAELRIQGATDQVIKTEAYNKRLSDSNDKLREEVAASSKQNLETQHQLAQVQQIVENLTYLREREREENQSLRVSNASLETERDAMMERMAGMQTEIDELKQKNTLLNDKVSDLEKSIAEVMNHQPHLAADVVEVSQVAEGVIA